MGLKSWRAVVRAYETGGQDEGLRRLVYRTHAYKHRGMPSHAITFESQYDGVRDRDGMMLGYDVGVVRGRVAKFDVQYAVAPQTVAQTSHYGQVPSCKPPPRPS